MTKHKSKARRGSDAESVTSTTSNNSRSTGQPALVVPGSPRQIPSKNANGLHPKRKASASALNKVEFWESCRRLTVAGIAYCSGCSCCGDVGRTTEESCQFQSTDVVDVYSLGRLLYHPSSWTHVLDCIGYRHSDHCVQRSHCIGQCSRKREKNPLLQSSKLV
jgi:hypothetical protein